MILGFLAFAASVASPQAPPLPAASMAPRSAIREQQGVRALDLRLGERVVLTFDSNWRPSLVSVGTADPAAVAARLGRPLDLNLKEAAEKPLEMKGAPGSDPHELNRAAPGTVIMTLVPYEAGTLLLVENGLQTAFRYHAGAMNALPNGGMSGQSTTLCAALPSIGTVESWARRYDALLIIKFEPTTRDDQRCIT